VSDFKAGTALLYSHVISEEDEGVTEPRSHGVRETVVSKVSPIEEIVGISSTKCHRHD
jgi:hypothetical protein